MRLKSLVVNEVSIVDKAANKRTFAIVKRDNTEEVVKAEVIEAQKVVDADKDELTPEQLDMLRKMASEVTELAALAKEIKAI